MSISAFDLYFQIFILVYFYFYFHFYFSSLLHLNFFFIIIISCYYYKTSTVFSLPLLPLNDHTYPIPSGPSTTVSYGSLPVSLSSKEILETSDSSMPAGDLSSSSSSGCVCVYVCVCVCVCVCV